MSGAFADLRLSRAAARIFALGIRPTVETILALVRLAPDRASAERVVEDIASLTPEQLAAAGADRLAPAPLHVVRGRQ